MLHVQLLLKLLWILLLRVLLALLELLLRSRGDAAAAATLRNNALLLPDETCPLI